jgi:hypothetical protein
MTTSTKNPNSDAGSAWFGALLIVLMILAVVGALAVTGGSTQTPQQECASKARAAGVGETFILRNCR